MLKSLMGLLGQTGSPTESIDAATVQKRLEAGESLFILDVREPWEFQQGHIPGATLIPLGVLPVRLNELPRDREIITVCRSGNRSAHAMRLLLKNGYRVRNMSGGMLCWTGEIRR